MTNVLLNDIIFVVQNKKEGFGLKNSYEARVRPTREPKTRKIQCRIDEDTDSILMAYCEAKHVSESEAVRTGIRKLMEEISSGK